MDSSLERVTARSTGIGSHLLDGFGASHEGGEGGGSVEKNAHCDFVDLIFIIARTQRDAALLFGLDQNMLKLSLSL